MRQLPLLLSLFAAFSLVVGCETGSRSSTPADDDDDDAGTAFPNPGAVDVPVVTGGLQDPLPDLMVDEDMLFSSANDNGAIVEVNMDEAVNQNYYQCAVAEGCIGSSGIQRLLKFDLGVVNRGEVDLVLGDPNNNLQDYEYSACHDHLHYKDFAKYELTKDGITYYGMKQAFCLIDLYDYDGDGNQPSQGYDCGFQGISKGWGDIYDSSLDCQWINITGITPGDYQLNVRINAENKIPEAGPFPNTATVTVTIGP